MRIVTSSEMSAIESNVIEHYKFSEKLIIENIAISGADILQRNFLDVYEIEDIIVLLGLGNNASDGLAIGRQLCNRGYSVRALLLFPAEDMNDETKNQLDLAFDFGVKVTEIKKADQLASFLEQTDRQALVLDAILGTGFRAPLSNKLFDIVNVVNQQELIKVAIDMATGIVCDNGAVSGNAIKADATLVIACPKTGHFIGEGAIHSGSLLLVNAGFPPKSFEGGQTFLLDKTTLEDFYDNRDIYGHKNTFGHCLVVGGSHGMTGAVTLASQAALAVGAGLVTASTWEDSYPELCCQVAPEMIKGLIPTLEDDVEEVVKELSRWDTIVVGPGLGRGERARDVVLKILNHFPGPVVVDADALRVLDMDKDFAVLAQRKSPTVLTPHIGEFADIAKKPKQDVIEDPLRHLKELVEKTNSAILLKGAASYLGLPNGEVYINYSPNDAMATSGSGDVLSGILGGLLAQSPGERHQSGLFTDHSDVFNAMKLGIMIHTLSGKHAKQSVGSRCVSAGKLIDYFPEAFKELDTDILGTEEVLK